MALFSNGHSQVNRVCAYILNQKKHHARKSFLGEYKELLEKLELSHDDRYVFRVVQWNIPSHRDGDKIPKKTTSISPVSGRQRLRR